VPSKLSHVKIAQSVIAYASFGSTPKPAKQAVKLYLTRAICQHFIKNTSTHSTRDKNAARICDNITTFISQSIYRTPDTALIFLLNILLVELADRNSLKIPIFISFIFKTPLPPPQSSKWNMSL
jgi:hypothetical protein